MRAWSAGILSDEQEQSHDQRADRAKRIAAHEEAQRALAGADMGTGRREFGLEIERAHRSISL